MAKFESEEYYGYGLIIFEKTRCIDMHGKYYFNEKKYNLGFIVISSFDENKHSVERDVFCMYMNGEF